MKNHFILDFETMGQNVFSLPFVDCAILTFDWDRFTSDNPYTFQELIGNAERLKVSVQDQVENYGAKVEKGTIDFWSKQDKSVRSKVAPKPDDITIVEFYDKLMNYLNRSGHIQFWWSRANTFDPIILMRYAKLVGPEMDQQLNAKLKYWGVRDTRSFIDAKTDFNKAMTSFCPMSDNAEWEKLFEKHNSIHDIAADVLRLQVLTRLDNNMEAQ